MTMPLASALLKASVSAFVLAAAACAEASSDAGTAETAADTTQEASAADQIIDDAPQAAWRAVDPDDLLVISTRGGDIWVELAPEFAPDHVARIRELVGQGFL